MSRKLHLPDVMDKRINEKDKIAGVLLVNLKNVKFSDLQINSIDDFADYAL